MSKTDTINTLNGNLETLTKQYHDSVDTLLRPALSALSDQIQDARQKLSAEIAEGATACPECKLDDQPVMPIGMILREEYVDKEGLHPRMYEVGCMWCARRSQSAVAEDAVSRWNAGNYLVKPNAR